MLRPNPFVWLLPLSALIACERATTPMTGAPVAEHRVCKNDSDCVLWPSGCCSWVAHNRRFQFAPDPGSACEVACRNMPNGAVCEGGVCRSIDPLRGSHREKSDLPTKPACACTGSTWKQLSNGEPRSSPPPHRSTTLEALRAEPERPGLVEVEAVSVTGSRCRPCPEGAQCQPCSALLIIADDRDDAEDKQVWLGEDPLGVRFGNRYRFFLELGKGYKPGLDVRTKNGMLLAQRPIRMICCTDLE